MTTAEQYQQEADRCTSLFLLKMKDYGLAWRILRVTSLTDQIFIKAKRLRTIEELGTQKIQDQPRDEYIGIINYSLMALIQLHSGDQELTEDRVEDLYRHYFASARNLMFEKNHDYGEAWRDMRISSYTDLILMKLLRIKQIQENDGETLVSEGVDANFLDMVNYAMFALIRISENEKVHVT